MFESLKKKLASWLGTSEKKEGKDKKENEKKVKKAKKTEKSQFKKEKEDIIKKIKKEIEIPLEFNAATQKYEPSLEKLKEEAENIEGKVTSEESGVIDEGIEIPKPSEGEIEEEKPKGNFFSKLFAKLSSIKINEENFNEIFSELEIILLENNVALEVVEKIRESLKKALLDLEVKRTDIDKKIINALKESILDVLIEPPNLLKEIEKKKDVPYVILFFGINGSGKTTSIAKLAHKLKKAQLSVVMAAADTFRAASIEQLQTHGKALGVDVIAHDYGADPAAVAFDAIQHAKKNHIKVVLIDTAGRMYTKQNLMKEMEKIVRVSKPDLKIFVGESITGNDATEQAKTFNEIAGIDGIILSKADVDDKAGTILSVSYVTNKPIYYLGMGQSYDDLKDFKKSDVLKNLGLA
jgi:fused signal recognition particle receptor